MCFVPPCNFVISPLSTCLRTHRFSEPTFGLSRPTNRWKNIAMPDFPFISRSCIFFLLTLMLCFSSVGIVGSWTSKLPSIVPCSAEKDSVYGCTILGGKHHISTLVTPSHHILPLVLRPTTPHAHHIIGFSAVHHHHRRARETQPGATKTPPPDGTAKGWCPHKPRFGHRTL